MDLKIILCPHYFDYLSIDLYQVHKTLGPYIYIYISLPIKIKQYVIMTGELFCIAIYAIMRVEKFLASFYILM